MDKGVLLPVETFNKVIDYLGTQPYNEVSQTIEEIRQSVRVVDVPVEEEESEDE